MPQATLPPLAKIWFLAVTPIIIVDAIFVLTRAKSANVPHPLAEVVPFSYWTIYAKYDRRYAANNDPFVVVQSWLNLVEMAMGLLVTLFAMCRAQNIAIKLAIVVCLMTLYKTVFYCLVEIAEGGKYTQHNTLQEKLTVLIAPLSVWIVVPSAIVRQCFRVLAVTNVPGPSRPKATASQQQSSPKSHGSSNNQPKKKH